MTVFRITTRNSTLTLALPHRLATSVSKETYRPAGSAVCTAPDNDAALALFRPKEATCVWCFLLYHRVHCSGSEVAVARESINCVLMVAL